MHCVGPSHFGQIITLLANYSMILLIENNETMRETTAHYLRLEGFDVRTANDGDAALAILAVVRPSVIFCDLTMPGTDGWAFRRRQRAIPDRAGIPFVIVSASLTIDEDARALDAVLALRKPCDLRELALCARHYEQPPQILRFDRQFKR